MAIKFHNVDEKNQTKTKQNKTKQNTKMATKIVQIVDFFFEMSFDTPAFKILLFASDLEYGTEVNKYY